MIHIIGGGLAGSEAAWQAVSLGVEVFLYEMRPKQATAVHQTDRLAELVCSNSFRGDTLTSAVGLLKAEMRQLKSLVMKIGDQTSVPAGTALAVDRTQFADQMTSVLEAHPLVTIQRKEIHEIPPPCDPLEPVIIATGPLTSASLSDEIATFIGTDHLYFYDAISPIVLADSIDQTVTFRASRWDREVDKNDRTLLSDADQVRGDYLNCPLTREEYIKFVESVQGAEVAAIHDFDNTKFFEGCLPIEVMASRGIDTLRFGPMKPIGLVDPHTSREPYAVVQLRQDNLAADHFSLVGFQTQLKWAEQERVLRLIPGLTNAKFVRFGMIHRNTYINAPSVLQETWQTRRRADLFFAGQISGVEGYVESAASGLIAGLNAVALCHGQVPRNLPRTTSLGALAYYVAHADSRNYQPTNMTFGLLPPLINGPRRRSMRRQAMAERALDDLSIWCQDSGKQVNVQPPAFIS
jgi:methylenetetrahydrofolate--tRNA-(uracil-5-)-methyltransferase|tara:strand:- start:531 stop:1925 length:1395 start_codon:yes stop_codon:yes gene_type:complete